MWPFKRREEQRAITEWPWPTGDLAPGPQPVSVDRALSLVPVLYTTGPDGVPRRQPAPSLFRQPSVHGTTFDWLHRAVISMALHGDAVGLITQRDYYGFPTMVEWLDPARVTVQDGMPAGPGSYMHPLWWWWGAQVNPDDLVHIPWFTLPYKIRGLSPIGAFAAAANVGLGAQDYAAAWFANGGVPPGLLRNTTQTMTQEDVDVITARVTKRLQSRKPLVIGNDWMYEPIALKPNEAQFVETNQLTATQIAVIYGIYPAERIGGTTGASLTYSTVEANKLDYLSFTLRPWLVRLEVALSNLFPRGTFVRFDTSELQRTDAKTRAEINRIELGPNVAYRTVDEVRAEMDLPPMPKPPEPVAPAAPMLPLNGSTPVAVGSSEGNTNGNAP